MSQWQDQIRDHAVWQRLLSLGPVIDQCAARDGIDSVGLDWIGRLRSVHAFIGRRLAAIDPALVHPSPLDTIGNSLQHTYAELEAFLSDGVTSHLETANSHASSAILAVGTLVSPDAPEEFAALSAAAASYRSDISRYVAHTDEALAHVRSQASALQGQLEALVNEAASQRDRITNLASEFQAQFSSAQDARATEFNENQSARLREASEAHNARQTRFDELVNSYSKRVNDRESDFAKELEAIRKDAADRLASVAAGQEVALKALQNDFQEAGKQVLDTVKSHLSDVEKLVGVIGNLGVTSGYQKAANSAQKSLWLWQFSTVVGLLAVIGFAYVAFLPAIQGDFSWERFAGRLALTIAVGVFAAYAAAQADRYMEYERRSRKMALELEALGPYLAPLPEEKQQEFRLQLADRTFGREEHGFGRQARSPATPVDVLLSNSKLRDFVVELTKAARGN